MKIRQSTIKKGKVVLSPNLTKISEVIDKTGRIIKSTTTEKIKKDK